MKTLLLLSTALVSSGMFLAQDVGRVSSTKEFSAVPFEMDLDYLCDFHSHKHWH